MKTKKQEELVNAFLSALGDEIRPLYHDLIMYLSELGYHPQKEKTNISFKHDLHKKQMAKMGFKRNKGNPPFFALRFSACRGYSQRFDDIVGAAVAKPSYHEAQCMENRCNYCAGKPATHVYTYTSPDGTVVFHCGAYALEIPDLTADDLGEIHRLIKEEHEYLQKHEVGIATI